ncbi:YkgJ family cysteine cluster protein [Cellulosilyticum sp. I15G10I2]|uniref:YkgJ family cysteine cluster protein n=1 Tax=Cellulosilyticum sp. I15G10I2 TaxID=1892843 RepID=UPI00085BFF25|nr:YkgJ family cysteine cluster protein [Cellulosilyticum sp. I15G10I2]
MKCRAYCAACCIAPSISSPIPGMLNGKKAGERCVQLDEHNRCRVFNSEMRPAVCANLQPSREMCGLTQKDALAYLTKLQKETDPS